MQRPRLRLSSPLIRHVTQALDVLIIWVCGWGVYQWHVATNDGTAPALRYELLVLAGSMALGWLGAWLAAGHHLRQPISYGTL